MTLWFDVLKRKSGRRGKKARKKRKKSKKKVDDCCTRKVKARYDVWPSAYASGAVTRCRKVGCANWGKSK